MLTEPWLAPQESALQRLWVRVRVRVRWLAPQESALQRLWLVLNCGCSERIRVRVGVGVGVRRGPFGGMSAIFLAFRATVCFATIASASVA